jgi:hypothetical protein
MHYPIISSFFHVLVSLGVYSTLDLLASSGAIRERIAPSYYFFDAEGANTKKA